MLVNIVRRAQALVRADETLPGSDALTSFLKKNYTLHDFKEDESILKSFGTLDDNDIWGRAEMLAKFMMIIFSPLLSRMLLERRLFKVRLSIEPIKKVEVESIRQSIMKTYNTLRSETARICFPHGIVSNEAYTDGHQINILKRNGELLDIAQASDLPNIKAISKIVKKNYLCWPKNVFFAKFITVIGYLNP
jgi:hypothetical protein